ncbi:MAG: homocysteine S-methyltransferase family protein, partial [Oscillospiraceae bacterium]|nr:homocysteine S-methyltransferase family protein [Oscillospiraceae bacterium]
MGTMLQKSGLKTGEIPELLNITHPEIIENIHSMYLEAGSDIVYANTFGANRYKLEGSGHTAEELIRAGIACAKKACAKSGKQAFTALDLGPIGQLLEPTGSLSFEEAYDIFKEQILAAEDADLIVLETMTDLYEVKAALLAAKENSDKP